MTSQATHKGKTKSHPRVRQDSSLASALFTSTQQRVLALLFGQPDRTYYVTQLVALAGSGTGSVQRELARLARSKLVIITKVGNQKHYQANPDSPLFDEICSIIKKTVGLQEPVKEALKPIADQLSLALIYGSIAKHSDTASSDIDLLLVSDELMLEEVYAALAPAEKLLNRTIHPTLYTTKEYEQRRRNKNAFLTKVLNGPTTMLLGSIDGE